MNGATVATAPFPEKHSPAWWVMHDLHAGNLWGPPTLPQLHQSLAGQLEHRDLALAMVDLIKQGRIRTVNVDHGDGTGWALTEAGLAEWRTHDAAEFAAKREAR